MENNGDKFASKKGLIIGGQDTCHGDSGGPLWVEEGGKQTAALSFPESELAGARLSYATNK